MSESFTFPVTAAGWRWAETRAADTLQTIAWRELGDAARWPELAALNDLLPPYITTDPAEAAASGGRVLLAGQHIRVFAADDAADATVAPAEVYGADIATDRDGFLTADGGDLSAIAGLPNLRGALVRRITTDRGELVFHDDYGSGLRTMIGAVASPARAALAAREARQTIARDARVARIVSARAETQGDSLALSIQVEPIASGAALSLRVEV